MTETVSDSAAPPPAAGEPVPPAVPAGKNARKAVALLFLYFWNADVLR